MNENCGKQFKISESLVVCVKRFCSEKCAILYNNQVEEDCELEQAADEWNTETLEEEEKSEEEKLSRELFKCTFGFDKETEEEKPHGEDCDCTNIGRSTYSMGNQCMTREINEALSEENKE